MSLAKRSYGYGYSKPQMNYHRQNSDSVTTVVTEISCMTVNEKPCYGAGAVQKHALLEEEVCEEDNVVYSGHHGGGAMQKHAFREDEVFEEEQVYPVHHGGAVQKHEYRKEVYQQQGGGGGYAAGHHGGAVQKHGYGQEAYHHGVDGGYALQYGSAAQKHGYGQKAYQHAAVDAGGYALNHHDSAVQKHGYGLHGGAAQKHGYGLHGGAVQKHGYEQEVCQQGGDVGAYDRAVVQKHGYGQKAYQHGAVGSGGYALHQGGETGGMHRNQATDGKAYKHEVAGLQHVCGLTHQYKVEHESEDESDCSYEESGDESGCEELAHGRSHDGGVHGYQQAYKQVEQHGGSHNIGGGVRHHAVYDRRSGSGTHYVSYESTKTEEYSGGGYGGWTQRKNRCII